MTFCIRNLKCILAIPILCALAGTTQAAGIAFRNKLNFPIIVQGTSIINKIPRNGIPIVIYPGRIAFDNRLPVGPRFLTIYHRNQPKRVLFRTPSNLPIAFQGKDMFFDICWLTDDKGRPVLDKFRRPQITVKLVKQFPAMSR